MVYNASVDASLKEEAYQIWASAGKAAMPSGAKKSAERFGICARGWI
jgi:hypothetical protein